MNAEVLAFVLYFVLMLAIGVLFFFKEKGAGEKEYFLGGRHMGPWVTAMSAQASDMSAWLLMGLPGSILAFGFGQIWIGIGLGIGTIANWIIVARRLRCFSEAANDSITLPQYLSNRFATKSLTLQIICAVIFLVCFTIYVASANRTSDELVQSGLLRQDLLYRLNAVEIHMPRLRERRADIPLLCSHFISRSSTLRNKRVRIRGVTDEALEILCAHTFPGNVRELANTIEYAGIVASGEWIRPKDRPYQFTNARPGLGEVERVLAGKTLQELERLAIETSYRANAGKRSAMVSELGISPRGLWNKLKEYGLQ